MMPELVEIDHVVGAAYNPRRADLERLEMLECSLRKLGFLHPLYAVRSDGGVLLLSGHQRCNVARRLGVQAVPVSLVRVPERHHKALNLLFNRATNDMACDVRGREGLEALRRIPWREMAAELPDKRLGSEEFYPCLRVSRRPVQPYLAANAARLNFYARSVARALDRHGVRMPVIVTPSGRVVNGIGRLQYLAWRGEAEADCVEIPEREADLAEALMNRLTMDFSLEDQYADELRWHSFRRHRLRRKTLGNGFRVFAGLRGDGDLTPEQVRRWAAVHGYSVLDFGGGHGVEAAMLRKHGIDADWWEPYQADRHDEVQRDAGVESARRLLALVASGKRWSSVFLSMVLNSVPFRQDREHILCLVSELCWPTGMGCIATIHQRNIIMNRMRGSGDVSASSLGEMRFLGEWEEGVSVAELSGQFKVQKYFSPSELREMLRVFWDDVALRIVDNVIAAKCRKPRDLDWGRVVEALRFEFDLPYPGGARMGLVDEAVAAFRRRRELFGRAA